MRRQNPPQECIERAREFEKYLNPVSLAMIYGICAVGYAIAVSIIFALMTFGGAITENEASLTVFAVVAAIPAFGIFLALFMRPNDPVSRYIRSAADSIRRPLPVSGDDCTFKVNLMDGEHLCVKMSFIYPAEHRSSALKEHLYAVVHGALSQDFSTRAVAPTAKEIEAALDKPLSALAEEHCVPVFYPEIRDVFVTGDEPRVPVTYTGTWS